MFQQAHYHITCIHIHTHNFTYIHLHTYNDHSEAWMEPFPIRAAEIEKEEVLEREAGRSTMRLGNIKAFLMRTLED